MLKGIRFYLAACLLLVASLWSVSAHASYYWTVNITSTQFPSPEAACTFTKNYGHPDTFITSSRAVLTDQSVWRYRCDFYYDGSQTSGAWAGKAAGWYTDNYTIARAGTDTGCPAGQVANPNGSCYTPQCNPPKVMVNGQCLDACPEGTRRSTANPARCLPNSYCQGHPSVSDACDSQGLGTALSAGAVMPLAQCRFAAPIGTVTINCDTVGGGGYNDNPDGSSPDPDSDKPNCPPGTYQIGIDGDGNARCKGLDTPPDPCPSGTRNIGVYPDVNCTSNNDNPPPPKTESKEEKPPTTTNNSDGSTTTSQQTTTTAADGTKTTTTTTTTTKPDGTKTTTVSQTCKDATGKTTVCASTGSGGGGGGDGDGDNPTGVSGDLYKKKDKTFQSVISSFKDSVMNVPAVAAGKNFFTVNTPSAGCPDWTVAIDYLHASIDVGQYFCTSFAQSMISLLGIGVLLGACFVAFRWAFL